MVRHIKLTYQPIVPCNECQKLVDTLTEKGSRSLSYSGHYTEPPLGVIREQGERPLRPKGARSMA